jgi:hypothetical protein
MSYQLCRWYDPYPKLAFALKMLYFAPGSLQRRAMAEVRRFVDSHWETVHLQRQLQEKKPQPRGSRWYDVHDETAKTVELIKNSPDTLKHRVGEALLTILSNETA